MILPHASSHIVIMPIWLVPLKARYGLHRPDRDAARPSTSSVVTTGPRPARSHDTLGAIIDALSECSESEWKAAEAQRVWERPAEELLKFTALPCRMAAAYFRVLHFHSHRGAGIEPGLHARAFPQFRGGKVMVGSRSRLQ